MANKAKGPPYEIPDGFTDMLQRFVVHILRNQPDNLLDCATEYFLSLQGVNKPLASIKIGQSREMSYLNLESSSNNDNSEEAKLQQFSQCLVAASKQTISNETSDAPCTAEEGVLDFRVFQVCWILLKVAPIRARKLSIMKQKLIFTNNNNEELAVSHWFF